MPVNQKKGKQMSKMSFMPQLKGFLLRNKVIYSVRKFDMPSGIVHIEDIGDAYRTYVSQIYSREELESYVNQSGFETLLDWWSKIKYFIPTDGPYFLYKVELR